MNTSNYFKELEDLIGIAYSSDCASEESEKMSTAEFFFNHCIKTAIKDEQTRIAERILHHFNTDMKELEAFDVECDEENPQTYCFHDVRALAGNCIYAALNDLGIWFRKGPDGKDMILEEKKEDV